MMKTLILIRLGLVTFILIIVGKSLLTGQDRTMGLIYSDDRATPGFTLFSNNQTSYLIDACGKIVNTWESYYDPVGDLHILDEGQLLRAGAVDGQFKAGGAGGVIELYTWEGALVWQYILSDEEQQLHHDIEPLPNGNILALVWELIPQDIAVTQGYVGNQELWSEKVIELQVNGQNQIEIIWEWSVWDHLIQNIDPTLPNYTPSINERPERININYQESNGSHNEDWWHFNSIAYNETFDQIALSSRHLSEVIIIDHSTSTDEAKGCLGGRYNKGGDLLFRFGNPQAYEQQDGNQLLFQQHSVNWVCNEPHKNHFSIFNNNHSERQSAGLIYFNPAFKDGQYKSVKESDYEEPSLLRVYSKPGFHSDILSSIQVLPNEYLFLVEGTEGRIIQVDVNNQLVWEYINPVNANGGPGIQGGTPRFNSLFTSKHYALDHPHLLQLDLTPGNPIELLPHEDSCGLVGAQILSKAQAIAIRLVAKQLVIESSWDQLKEYLLIDNFGRMIQSLNVHPGLNSYSTVQWPTGLYYIIGFGPSYKVIIY